uniref:PH domain-containing protein n=1 Tax=Streptomyces sp. NBC_01401 TaxID=2903854 RepID=A0AAU3H0G6_9ACTN
MTTLNSLYQLAADEKSAEVTDWSARISWVIGLLVLIAFVYWLMRQGWKWRGSLQSDLPELATTPEGFADGEKLLTLTGRYHASTTAGQWLDRIVAHGLGTRSRVELTLTAQGLDVVRPGAADFFVPAADLREARTDKALAGKVLPEGGLLVITWAHGGKLIDSGFRSDHSAEHQAWVDAVNHLTSTTISTTEGTAR